MKKIIFATGNQGKLREIRAILNDADVEVLSMKEAGFDGDIEENGTTFEENALIKARTIAEKTGLPTLADDSGLEIDYLNGEPGIYSARYLGEDTPHSVKNPNLISRLEGVPDEKRTARFVCAVAAVFPDNSEKPDGTQNRGSIEKCVRATMEGRIAYEEAGENGFGYDPIFYLPEYGCTNAQLTPEQKNAISHRGKALRAMYETLKTSGLI
ncbi:MAG: XTP/dITP diphosphatase [Lachnospiraceae bacterium]|nr:XTP/dITP diphosphatase [Lachnospiraceae bacterium]